MALDKEIKKFLDACNAANNPPYSSFSPVELRKQFNTQFFAKKQQKPIKIASVEEHCIEGRHGELKCRVYYPATKSACFFPALMYFHGGGFVIRDNMDVYDQTCRMICAGANCVVIAVDFSLAPENPFPAAPEDCYTATCWVAQHAEKLHIDRHHFGVWGESCGGNLATVVAMMARDRDGPQLCCQIIITAMLDYYFNTASYLANGQGDYFLTEDSMRWFWDHYLSDKNDIRDPYCAPLQATDLKNLPPSLVVTVEYDPLRDEGKAYAERLQAAGITTKYLCYPGLIHGFFDLYHVSGQAQTACREIIDLSKTMIA